MLSSPFPLPCFIPFFPLSQPSFDLSPTPPTTQVELYGSNFPDESTGRRYTLLRVGSVRDREGEGGGRRPYRGSHPPSFIAYAGRFFPQRAPACSPGASICLFLRFARPISFLFPAAKMRNRLDLIFVASGPLAGCPSAATVQCIPCPCL